MKAVDVGGGYQSWLTADDARTLKAQGFDLMIIGRQPTQWYDAPRQRQFALDAGMQVGQYWESLTIGAPFPIPLEGVRFNMIAVEENSHFETEEQIDVALVACEQQGLVPVIYTSAYEWQRHGLTNVTKYGERGIALAVADYTGTPNFTLRTPFGGWTHAKIHQHTVAGENGAPYLPGIPHPLDIDEIDDAWLASLGGDMHQQLTGPEVTAAGYLITIPGTPPLLGVATARTEPTDETSPNGEEKHVLWIRRG